jgi:hypothetical protein
MCFSITARLVIFAAMRLPGFFSPSLDDVLLFVISAH